MTENITLSTLVDFITESINRPREPRYYDWACSKCKRAGKAMDPTADCPRCGGKSVFNLDLEGQLYD